MVPLNQAVRLLSPRLTVLVTTTDRTGKVNAAPFSWIVPVSFKPPIVCLVIGKGNKGTLPNIQANKEFVVNLVSENWAQAAINCARPGEGKLKREGLGTERSKMVRPPKVRDAQIALECKLVDILNVPESDHFLVLGRIVQAVGELDLDKTRPVMHVSGEEFRSVGKKITLER